MKTEVIGSALTDLKETISSLKDSEFTQPITGLSGGTIGEHTRHIIELLQCLFNGYKTGIINYDNRERNLKIQTEISEASNCIDEICKKLSFENKILTLQVGLFEHIDEIETNFNRELLYNFEHCIHHQALIKVGLLELKKHLLNPNFGVAVSTIKFRDQCAQ